MFIICEIKIFFFNYIKFFRIILIRLLICFSSSNLISIWIRLEINFYSFLPILIIKRNFKHEKSLIIYFWTQRIASNTFLFLILSTKTITISYSSMSFLRVILIFKIGIFPFHTWILSIIEKISWFITAFILSIQKILPIIILSIILFKTRINILIIFNTIFSRLRGIKTFSLRKIFIFSSLNHLSIILFSILYSKKTTFIYITLYTIINFSLSKIFEKSKIDIINQLFYQSKKRIKSFSRILIVIRIIGLPPFLGFIPKTIIFVYILENKEIFYLRMFLILNTLSTYFYLRIIVTNMILTLNKEKNTIKNIFNFNTILIYSFLTNFLLI